MGSKQSVLEISNKIQENRNTLASRYQTISEEEEIFTRLLKNLAQVSPLSTEGEHNTLLSAFLHHTHPQLSRQNARNRVSLYRDPAYSNIEGRRKKEQERRNKKEEKKPES